MADSGNDLSVRKRATFWQAADPDPETRAELGALLDRGPPDLLEELFDGRLLFGTAGLRAEVGVGPNRMNRMMAAITAAAVSRVLADEQGGDDNPTVVTAHDARHGSADFAAEMRNVLINRGVNVLSITGPAPTPLAAFAVRHFGTAAGIVVTASHNPASDNGIKVYWSDGAQIAPPVDSRIAEEIDTLFGELWNGRLGLTEPSISEAGRGHATLEDLGAVVAGSPLVEAYLSEASDIPHTRLTNPVVVACSSMHGVGADLLELALGRVEPVEVVPVPSQRDPDPDFPTVHYPNPEEPGAMSAVVGLAEEVSATLALANDPDADRLAIAAPNSDGIWQVLSGDETGAVLTEHLLGLTESCRDRLVATTVVSSRLVAAMAAEAGVHFEETLTGFKWLCRPGIAHPEWTQILTYEEALGYAIGPRTRDKDGVTAAIVAVDLARRLQEADRTVWDLLDDLARRHGAHVTNNGSWRFKGPDANSRLEAVATGLVEDPPGSLGGIPVLSSDQPANGILRLWLEDDTRVVLRPSGTEPKFKYYCEAIESVGPDGDTEKARKAARARLAGIHTELQARFERI